MSVNVTYYKPENNLPTTGEDIIFFHIFFQTDGYPECPLPLIVSLDDLFDFVLTKNEAEGHYLKSIRETIPGYGPKHSKILQMISDEAFDLEPYIFSFVESKDQEFLKAHMEWCELMRSPASQKFIEQKAAMLDQLVNSDYISNQIKFVHFQEEVDKALHELTMQYYPSLFEMEGKDLRTYKECLVRTTMSFAKEIDFLVNHKWDIIPHKTKDEDKQPDPE